MYVYACECAYMYVSLHAFTGVVVKVPGFEEKENTGRRLTIAVLSVSLAL